MSTEFTILNNIDPSLMTNTNGVNANKNSLNISSQTSQGDVRMQRHMNKPDEVHSKTELTQHAFASETGMQSIDANKIPETIDTIENQNSSLFTSVIEKIKKLPKSILLNIKDYIDNKCTTNNQYLNEHPNTKAIYNAVNERLREIANKNEQIQFEHTRKESYSSPAESMANNEKAIGRSKRAIKSEGDIVIQENEELDTIEQEEIQDTEEQNVLEKYNLREYASMDEFRTMADRVRELLKTADHATCSPLFMWVENQNKDVLASSLKRELRKEIEHVYHIQGMKDMAIKYTQQIKIGGYKRNSKQNSISSKTIQISETEQFKELQNLKENIRTWPQEVQKLPEFKELEKTLKELCPDISGKLSNEHQKIIDEVQHLMSQDVYSKYANNRDIYFYILDTKWYELLEMTRDPNITDELFIQALNREIANLDLYRNDIKAMRRGEHNFRVIEQTLYESWLDNKIVDSFYATKTLEKLFDVTTYKKVENTNDINRFMWYLKNKPTQLDALLDNARDLRSLPYMDKYIAAATKAKEMAEIGLEIINENMNLTIPEVINKINEKYNAMNA